MFFFNFVVKRQQYHIIISVYNFPSFIKRIAFCMPYTFSYPPFSIIYTIYRDIQFFIVDILLYIATWESFCYNVFLFGEIFSFLVTMYTQQIKPRFLVQSQYLVSLRKNCSNINVMYKLYTIVKAKLWGKFLFGKYNLQ